MWIFQNDAALSIVAHRDEPGSLLVRSRIRGDIERALPILEELGIEVAESETADYRYRAVVSREIVAEAVAGAVRGIGYPNFKASVPDGRRRETYTRVWGVLAGEYGAYGDAGREGS